MIASLSIIIIFIQLFQLSLSWGPTGHMIVANAAKRMLSEEALKNIEPILNGHDIELYSILPDRFSHTIGGMWNRPNHYIDIHGESFDISDDCKDMKCVYGAVLNYTHKLSKENEACVPFENPVEGNNPEPCNLEFLVHFVTDIHSPLHIAHHKVFPRGGSRMPVNLTFLKDNKDFHGYVEDKLPNLHYVWDAVLVEEYILRKYGKDESGKIKWENWALDIVKELKDNDYKLLKEYQELISPFDWVNEVYEVSNKVVNDFSRETYEISEEYFQRVLPHINTLFAKSTARLLEILERRLG